MKSVENENPKHAADGPSSPLCVRECESWTAGKDLSHIEEDRAAAKREDGRRDDETNIE